MSIKRFDGTEKGAILLAITAWLAQRPGLEFGNYGTRANYQSESRKITRQRNDALHLLRSVRNSGITADDLKRAFIHAFSGRLTVKTVQESETRYSAEIDYCTGQYWPTEYRAAVCAVLSSALWTYIRDSLPESPPGKPSKGDNLRDYFRCEFGNRIAKAWFN